MVLSRLWNECHLSYSLYMLDSVTEIALEPKEGALRNSAGSTEGGGEVKHSLWRLCRSNSAPAIPSGNSVAAVTPLSGAQQTLLGTRSLSTFHLHDLCTVLSTGL